ncbi:hypothetical protein I7X12_12065 [Halosimplex litoreum]|uniref:L-alanine-DL-glutamate epimerase n=1 Tax=Halosimplex litoreum TaxID=1198301 RepID=A0A7T3FVI4_9EURY|nr:hypothetical protein [Halosimplex litoreum]QPV61501.1 hypothetical protein I7X12_12065 [Halosimplex litoreum]
MSDLYDEIADLPLAVEGFDLDRHEMDTSAGFTRVTTVVELHGPDGKVGRGEDVAYDTEDHDRLREAHEGGALDWEFAGEYAFDEFSTALDDVELFPEPPEQETARQYRRWAVESAALDLALRQAETTFADALGRSYDPLRFVVSTRLDTEDDPSAERIHEWLDIDPAMEFKLDPTDEWTAALMDDLAATDSVRILDLKSYYEGTEVDTDADPERYRQVAEAFPDAVLEDAKFTDETEEILDGVADRLSWDYPVVDVESVENLPIEPEWLNIKPSRFGTVSDLLDTIEYCLERDITLYGGGQYELGVGREHLHAVASVFYPDGPNDIAPSAYHSPEPHADVPASPLAVPEDPVGLRWSRE